MTALVTVVCAVCNIRIGEVVPAEDGYALDYTRRYGADEDDEDLTDPDRMKPHRKQIRHDFTAEPTITTLCPHCRSTVIWTLNDVKSKIDRAERDRKPQRHAVGVALARKKQA